MEAQIRAALLQPWENRSSIVAGKCCRCLRGCGVSVLSDMSYKTSDGYAAFLHNIAIHTSIRCEQNRFISFVTQSQFLPATQLVWNLRRVLRVVLEVKLGRRLEKNRTAYMALLGAFHTSIG